MNGGSVMENAHSYIKDIFQQAIVPFSNVIGNGFILMQHNTKLYRARIVADYLEVSIAKHDWLPCSPDLKY